MSRTRKGFFLIADITGYTQYLSESELEHAQDTLTALLELLVENTRPPLVISRLAGDAVISYGFEEDFFQGQSFIETIEDIYVTFRKTIERLVLNNTCKCKACANVANLDLKFFVHYGTFGIQRISDHDELVGNDVNLIHRLLKNSVTESTGLKAYALYTDASIRHLDLEDFIDVLEPHLEAYEHLGEVKVWIQDMHSVWEKKRADTVVVFPTDRGLMQMDVEINMPRERVWDYMIQPKFRNFMVGSNRMEIINRSHGRISEGSIYECYHGDMMAPHIILEWKPFKHMIVREGMPLFPKNNVISETRVDSIEGGTKLTRTYAPVTGPFLGRAVSRIFPLLLGRVMNKALRTFKNEIESDYQAHRVLPDGDVEISEKRIREAAADSLQASSKIKPA